MADRASRNARPWLDRARARWRAMQLSTKAVWLSVALTTIVITTVFISLTLEIRQETRQILQDLLNRSEQQVVSIKEDRLSQLLWMSSQVANNPTLRAAMETFRLESPPRFDHREELLATLQNELDKIWAGLPKDLLIVTNAEGGVLVANGTADDLPDQGVRLAVMPAVERALNPNEAVGDQNFGLMRFGDHYFLAAASPIVLQDYVIGTLVLGDRIDSSFLPNLRAFFGGNTVITVGGKTIASTLPDLKVGDPNAELPVLLADAVLRNDSTVLLEGHEYLVDSMVLGADESGAPATLFLLRSLTEAMRQPNGKLMKILATQALLAILLGAALAWAATRVSLRPLAKFTDFMKEVAATGDYSRRFERRKPAVGRPSRNNGKPSERRLTATRSNNELDLLVDGFNGMLSEIEDRDNSLKSAHRELEAGVEVLKEKEEELRHLQKMEALGLLAGGVAHDFNNILTVVTGFSDMALKSLSRNRDQEAAEFIEEARKASESAALLTRQLLAFSSKQVTSTKVVDINRLITERKEIFRRVVGDSVSLELALQDDLDRVLADPAQVEQVLMNLIVNARDAMDSDGEIRIETCNVLPDGDASEKYNLELSGPHVLLSVTDSGCGIDAETMEHMFEPFYTTKGKGKGTGLGLSTVHGVIRQCGGQIRVESDPGAGTAFRVFFPAIAEAAQETGESPVQSPVSGTATILLVEDEADVRNVVGRMLASHGYTVLPADGPRQALDLVEKHGDRVDLLLTDVIMPMMNGRELSNRISQMKPGIRTLFMSGFTAGVIDDTGVLSPGVDFLQKPFTPDALAAKISRILAQ